VKALEGWKVKSKYLVLCFLGVLCLEQWLRGEYGGIAARHSRRFLSRIFVVGIDSRDEIPDRTIRE